VPLFGSMSAARPASGSPVGFEMAGSRRKVCLLIAVVDVGRIGGSADEGFMAEGCQSLPSKGLERDWNGSRVMVRDGEIASRSEGRRARAVSLRHQDVLDSFLQCLTALMVSEGADDGWNDSISMGMIQFRWE
jgi:hypothetical protein